jgi:hypothetical protein
MRDIREGEDEDVCGRVVVWHWWAPPQTVLLGQDRSWSLPSAVVVWLRGRWARVEGPALELTETAPASFWL